MNDFVLDAGVVVETGEGVKPSARAAIISMLFIVLMFSNFLGVDPPWASWRTNGLLRWEIRLDSNNVF